MSDWTQPSGVTEQILRIWDKGNILSAKVTGEAIFPLQLRLRRPDGAAYGSRFDEVRRWIRVLEEGSRAKCGFGYDIGWSSVNHRQLGRNRIPSTIYVPTEGDALRLIARKKEALRFEEVLETTRLRFPVLLNWLSRKPLLALAHATEWSLILEVITWFQRHPKSNLYLRQLDIKGVESKFVETHKSLLAELIDIVLGVSPDAAGTRPLQDFEQRYGLRVKPAIIRFRILDQALAIGPLCDIATPAPEFASLLMPVKRIFITENEINGLAFPSLPESIVIFGLGYGIELLRSAEWMNRCSIYYWGDIDTHGFAILDRLRAIFPHAESLLMDCATLLEHRSMWVSEETPFRGVLPRLGPEELELFESLVNDQFGPRIRMEQERIAFTWVCQALRKIVGENMPLHLVPF
jgi:hypothetical protein